MSSSRLLIASLTLVLSFPAMAQAAASDCNDIFFCFDGPACEDSESLMGQMVGAIDGVGELLCFVGDPKCSCFQAITGDVNGQRFDEWADRANDIISACGNSSGGGRSLSGIAFEAAKDVCTPTFDEDVRPVLEAACDTCHITGTSGNLNFANGRSDLVNVPSGQSSLVLVKPGDPDGSYLFHKIAGTHLTVGGSGGQMPAGGTLSPVEMDTIEAWILGGALP